MANNNGIQYSNGYATKLELKPGRRRIQTYDDSDSDSDDGGSQKKRPKIEVRPLSTQDKEVLLREVVRLNPDYPSLDAQTALHACNWDVKKASAYLSVYMKKKATTMVVHQARRNGAKSSKKTNRGSDDSDEGELMKPKDQVYDSDDSDTGTSNVMTSQRQSVFDFFNNASAIELQSVKTCSEKKAMSIIELRPFRDWFDLKEKIGSQKYLSTEMLNYCQELLNRQNNVANIMAKCNKLVKKLEAAIDNGAGITEQPAILQEELKLSEYQLIGLNWLVVMHRENMNGILADEMGLGKTIQVIAFLAYLKENNLVKGCHLIVVPSSTLDNWDAELQKWCPNLVVEKYYGSQDERRMMRIKYAKGGFDGIDVLLTTYHQVASTPEERKMFRVCKMHYVIFDEAHMLKNMTTQRYAQLMVINAEMRLLLTGTPLQNNLLELMSLLCFVMPSFFGKNTEDIKSLFQKKGKKDNDDPSLFEKSQIDQAKRIMKPFVLRRLKKDVLKYLPKKIDQIEKITMNENQKQRYKELCEYYSNAKGEIKGSSEIAGSFIMMEMRKLANHPLLMRYYFLDDDVHDIAKKLARCSTYKKVNPQHIFEELACMSDFQIWQLCNKNNIAGVEIPDELILDSGKFQRLDTLLPKLKEEGHRVLIFSQFTMMLDIIEKYMEIREHSYLRLDGSTVVTERQEMIDAFNEDSDIFCFLLSTRAGGMGINLTAADVVIIHDIDFNPYNDKQAEDRCHRIGQTKPVTIYRMVSEGTIEEGMLMVAQEKLNLEKEIQQEITDVEEHKCMVRLLTMALGLDEKRAEVLMSPPQKKSAGTVA